jgi:hypothetical protein
MALPFTTTTSYANGAPAQTKPFTWSYSKIKNWRNCPKKHFEVDILKSVQEERSQALSDGEDIHKAMELRVKKNIPLPPAMQQYEPEAAKVVANMAPGTILLVEEKAALRRDFTSCGYFDPKVWLRMKIDVAKVLEDVAVAIDWKTGKIVEDSEQLAITAQWIFSHFPKVQRVRTKYVWLGNYAETVADFSRQDMVALWNHLWPELQEYEQACATATFPPKPGGLCRSYCPVSSCAFHGRGNR